jgi:adhesin/invasin
MKTPHPFMSSKIKENTCRLRSTLSFFAWMNMVIQILFPVSIAFTPVMAATASQEGHRGVDFSQVRPYQLQKGESIHGIAERFHLSVAELKKLNQFRTFSKPFEKLSSGDELDVPADTGQTLASEPPPATAGMEQWMAQGMSSIAQATNGPHHAGINDVVISQARSQVSYAGSGAVQQWLSQLGTARVQLGMNDQFSIGESAVDVLVPLYDNQTSMLFTQLGGRYQNQRTTLNAGMGIRLFRGNWMYGVNTFLDNDLTGHNRRLGIGGEAWADNLKLSANSYFGLTDWHTSRDVEDYNERPADGFDVTAEAYLPALPQLGAKVKYEQYMGNEVALVSQNSRQKDPKALTLGLNYTPVPLVTLGTDYRKSGSHDELQLSAQFAYNFGQSWTEQISADSVAFAHSLAGSRKDLVERNNEIVLNYRKQELVTLSLPGKVEGKALERQPLALGIKAKHGLKNIEWQSGTLDAAGGKIIADGSQWFIQFPDYSVAQQNQYLVTAVAYDLKGNRSAPVDMLVLVRGTDVDVTTVAATVADGVQGDDGSTEILADAHSTVHFDLTLKDSAGHPVTGQASRITLPVTFTPGTGNLTTASRFSPASVFDVLSQMIIPKAMADEMPAGGVSAHVLREREPGVYEIEVTAGTKEGKAKVTPHLDGKALTSLQLTLVSPAVLNAGDLQVIQDNQQADGVATNLVRITVKDSQGQPVSAAKVSFSPAAPDDGSLSVPATPVTTDAHGVAEISVTSIRPGDYAVKVWVGQSSQTVMVHFNPTQGQLIAGLQFGPGPETTSVAANGVATGHLTFTVKNADGTPAVQQSVHFSMDGLDVADSPTSDTGEVTVQIPAANEVKKSIVEATLVNQVTQSVTILYTDATKGTPLQIAGDIALLQDTPPQDGAGVSGGNGGVLSFVSDNEAVVSVDQKNGRLTPAGAGTAVITVTEMASGSFAPQFVTYHVTVLQSIIRIMRANQPLQENPVVGDTLTVEVSCTDSITTSKCGELLSTYQWFVEATSGSGNYAPISGATTREYVVPREYQKRRIRVSAGE